MDRYYLDEPLKEDATYTLSGTEVHHLVNVIRKKLGEQIELVNGKGALATATIIALTKRKADVLITSKKERSPPSTSLIAAQGFTRTRPMEFIVEKGTELGMTELWLYPGELSERDKVTLPRLQAIAISAMKQCGRLYLPLIKEVPPIVSWKKPKLPLFFGNTERNSPPLTPSKEGLIFVTGPEKGLSQNETEALLKLNAQGVTLNSNILRTETATLAALAIAANSL